MDRAIGPFRFDVGNRDDFLGQFRGEPEVVICGIKLLSRMRSTRAPPWAFTRTRYTVSVHTIHVTSALTRSPHLEGSASSHRPRGATSKQGDSGLAAVLAAVESVAVFVRVCRWA